MTEKHEALAVRQTEELEALRAAGIDLGDQTGRDNLAGRRITLPLLAIAQKMSPQLEVGSDSYLEDLKFGDIFNANPLIARIYPQPLEFIPLFLHEHAIEFHPFDLGGGIKDRNVPIDDPRCEWGANRDEKPAATVFKDWRVLLLPDLEPVVLSFKSTNLKVAEQFRQALNAVTKAPLYATKWEVRTVKKTKTLGNQTLIYSGYALKAKGLALPEQAGYAKLMLDWLRASEIIVDHVAEPEDGSTADRIVDGEAESIPF